MEVYACHEKATSSLILEFPPTQMTVMDCIQAQKVDPAINQVATWIESKKLDTVKVGEEMSPELMQYSRQRDSCACEKESCIDMKVKLDRTTTKCSRWSHPNIDWRLYGAHNDVGHLGLERMLNILHNWFYWPGFATCHVCTGEQCPRFKSKQDNTELYPLLATYPLELVHMDFLTIENPYTGADMNLLLITSHFTWYAKAVVTPNQSAKATVAAFWNKFKANYSIPEKLLTNQGCHFESQLIKEFCKFAHIWKV